MMAVAGYTGDREVVTQTSEAVDWSPCGFPGGDEEVRMVLAAPLTGDGRWLDPSEPMAAEA